MLRSINIVKEASYSDAGGHLAGLRQLNFIFGTNGSGKTTISRVIANPAAYLNCCLDWENGRELERLVYNSDFIAQTLTPQMHGIFTLGEGQADTLAQIANVQAQIEQLHGDIAHCQIILDGENKVVVKMADLASLRTGLEEACWKQKIKHDAYFQHAFSGYRSKKLSFCDKVLEELSSNSSALLSLDDLKTRAEVVFKQALERIASLPNIEYNGLTALETDMILEKGLLERKM